MALSNFARSLILLAALAAFGCSGTTNDNSNEITPTAERPVSSIPFGSLEPVQYKAVAAFGFGDVTEKKYIAKKDNKRRTEHGYGAEARLIVIEDDKTTLIDPQRRVYTERAFTEGKADPDFLQDMTRQLLAVREKATYRELGEEDGRIRYSVQVADSEISEIIVFADPKLGMPTRQEFYSVTNDERRLRYWYELTNIELDVEDELFTVPEGFRKISNDEFYRGLKSPGTK